MSLYWSSPSLHRKEPPNRISCKSTKAGPIRSSRTWKKSCQISKSYALQHIETFFSQEYKVNWWPWLGLSVGSSHPKIRLSQTPFLTKSQDLLKICGKFLVFPSVIKWTKFTLPMSYQHRCFYFDEICISKFQDYNFLSIFIYDFTFFNNFFNL